MLSLNSSYPDVPNEVWGKIFALTPSISRIGNSRGYDTTILESIACVCKQWRDVCYSDQEWAPYTALFRRQFSKVAPFGGSFETGEDLVRDHYLWTTDNCLVDWSVDTLMCVIKLDYELCLSRLLQRISINRRLIFYIEPEGLDDGKENVLETGTILKYAIRQTAVRCVNVLLTDDEINCDNVLNGLEESNDEFITAPALGVALDYLDDMRREMIPFVREDRILENGYVQDLIKIIRCLIEHKNVRVDDCSFCKINGATRALIGKTCADLIAKKEPKALIPLLQAAAALKDKEAVQVLLNQIKALGLEVFGDQFLMLLCIAGDPQLETYLPRFNLNQKDIHTLLQTAKIYDHLHLIPFLQSMQNPPHPSLKRSLEEIETNISSNEPLLKKQKSRE